MTDKPNSVLTFQKIVEIENLTRPLEAREWESVLDLCASHRVLHQRHRLLLRRVKELETLSTDLEAQVMDYTTRVKELEPNDAVQKP